MVQRCFGQFEQEGGFPVHPLEVAEELLDDVFFGPHADTMDKPNQELHQLIDHFLLALSAESRHQGIANGRRVQTHLAWGFGGGSQSVPLENLGRHVRKQVYREAHSAQVLQFLQFCKHAGQTDRSRVRLKLTKHRGDDGRVVHCLHGGGLSFHRLKQTIEARSRAWRELLDDGVKKRAFMAMQRRPDEALNTLGRWRLDTVLSAPVQHNLLEMLCVLFRRQDRLTQPGIEGRGISGGERAKTHKSANLGAMLLAGAATPIILLEHRRGETQLMRHKVECRGRNLARCARKASLDIEKLQLDRKPQPIIVDTVG